MSTAALITKYRVADQANRPVLVLDAGSPVGARAIEHGLGRVVRDAHLGNLVLHLGVVRHRVGQRDRRALRHASTVMSNPGLAAPR